MRQCGLGCLQMRSSFIGVLVDAVQMDTNTCLHGPSFLRGNNSIYDSTDSKENCQEPDWRHFTGSASQSKTQSMAKIILHWLFDWK